ncbi:hypothetical protein Q4557_18465 [Shewanella sp. 5_MG-2023]|uniref:hypothetical protein n=1 Tax=Shewanella sp. 5_MG-2023 TaxID=3062656 RepID=UPI0026E16CA9|nr:hypothetical protein [Shewanella sp. 5_MG-2023]MDO6641942.1 hypothetical protein [Shewanella sp. 5_MG-2023]
MDSAIFENYSKYPISKLSRLGLHLTSIRFLSENGLPEWCAPNMYFGEEDCWLPELNAHKHKLAVLGSDRNDHHICISLNSNQVFRVTNASLDFMATTPELLGKALEQFQLCINSAVAQNGSAFTENDVDSAFLKPFAEWLKKNEPEALSDGSFWRSTLNWLKYT